jgi:hypothetical protein
MMVEGRIMKKSKSQPSWRRPWMLIPALVFCLPVQAAPLFEDSSVLEVQLSGPVSSLIENKEDRTELPFTLSVDGLEHQLMVRPRGKSRVAICDLPPLRFNFDSSDGVPSAFAGQDKLKLVTHCLHKGDSEKNTIEEYVSYRLFSLLSDAAYKARLLRITYLENGSPSKDMPAPRFGFVIESKESLAGRIGAEKLDLPGISIKPLDQEQAALVYVFQYVVGNTDWSLVLAEGDDECCHNIDLFKIGRKAIIVPYDFDLVGLVNTPYAKPDPTLRMRSVRMRRYRGYCTDKESLLSAVRKINSMRAEIIAELQALPVLTEEDKADLVTFIERYFEKAQKESKLVKDFDKRCLE